MRDRSSFLCSIGLRRQNIARVRLRLFIVGFLFLASAPLRADVVTLNPVADTWLSSISSDSNFGSDQGLKIGTTGVSGAAANQRGLLRFDVANAVPAGATIQLVQLHVTVSKANASGDSPGFRLFPVLTDWAESQATWNSPWSAPGGASGTDYASTGSGAVTVTVEGEYAFNSTPAMVADVQQWLNNPNSNHGWMVICDQEGTLMTARRFGSRESITPPRLDVEFLAPPRIDAVTLADGAIQFQFTAESSYSYQVQFSESAASPNWQVLTNINANLGTFDALISNSITNGPQRFYRVARIGQIP